MAVSPTSTSANSQILATNAATNAQVVATNYATNGYILLAMAGTVNINGPGYYTLCKLGAGTAVDVVFNNNLFPPQTPSSFVSIYSNLPSTVDLNLVMNPVGSFIPVSNMYLGGPSGLTLSGNLNVNGNLTVGLDPNHPPPPPGC
jgi:hypothetical protein